MMMNPYKFLHFVKSKSIPNWSVQYADEEDLGFTRKYPMARIGSLLTRKKEPIDIQDGVIYKRVTISTKDGNISIRDEKDGKDIRTKKQFIIHEGQFLLSKIDARNGAYGVVPVIAENAIITGNFWTFDVDYDRINPQFLTLVTKTKQFLSFAEKSSNGTTNRHYLQETAFLNQQIPLPSIEEQEKILTEYNLNYGYYLSSLKEIENEKVNIGNYIIEKLSLNTKDSKGHSDNILNLQKFSSLISWSVERAAFLHEGILKSNLFVNRLLGDIVDINPKTEIKHLKEDTVISFIPMQSISEEYACWKGHGECTVLKSKGYTKFQEGDLLWAKITPCMQNGKSAIVHNLKNGFGCGSTEFHVLRSSNTNVDLNYIHCLLRLDFVLEDATRFFTGSAGQQRVPASYLENLLVPLPPIEIQREIISHCKLISSKVDRIRQNGARLAKIANYQFEEIISK